MLTRRIGSSLVVVITFTLFCIYFRQWNHSRVSVIREPYENAEIVETPQSSSPTYTRTLVIGRRKEEDVSWSEDPSLNVSTSIYIVDNDDPLAELRIPQQKGHEAMVYLTYIIDHYDNLSDTTIFLHPHLEAWHNNDLLDSSAATTLKHLSDAHVARVGYFNTRCHHEPGCPDWLHLDRPDSELDTGRKMEEKSFSASVWEELHPGIPPPHAISQPCCAQFAVSRDRIRAHPQTEYIRYRDWLIHTELDDIMSGRVMEYTWQYIFTGLAEVCPPMNECYCDGYGICFGGATQLKHWFDVRTEKGALYAKADELSAEGGDEGEIERLRRQAREMDARLEEEKKEAFERGADPRSRALECRRPWEDGDGY